MVNRPINKKRLFAALVITTVIFVAGFFVSYNFSYYQYSQLAESQENLKYSILSLELQRQLVDCEAFTPFAFSEELNNAEKTVSLLEEKLGKKSQEVLNQKELYSLLQIQHFLIVRDYNEKCKQNITTILFFYSNEGEELFNAEKMGTILSKFKAENENVMIYSFDSALKNDLIGIIKKRYGVVSLNTVVINEKIKLNNLTNIDQLNEWNLTKY